MHKIIEEDLKFIIGHKIDWELLRDKTVLISGINGLLPSYMAYTMLYLNKKGYNIRIIGIARSKERAYAKFFGFKDNKNLQLMIQDICDPIDINEEINYIIHAASHASPKYYGIDPVGTLLPNVLGTYRLLELAREKNVDGFLFFSTGDVNGDVAEDQIPTSEDIYGGLDPLALSSSYAESKRMGENMCFSWNHQYGVPAKIVRPTHTYGPGMKLDDARVFADFVSDIVNNRDIVVKSDGLATRAFCYIADATVGFFQVLFKGDPAKAYNVGSDVETSIGDLAKLLVGLFPEKGLKVVMGKGSCAKECARSKKVRGAADIKSIKKLGWKIEHTVEEGFKRTVRSYI
ncbi:NAD-dependent epimerase/dehydratase family protein [Candidatus Omnitrophota bacterium]